MASAEKDLIAFPDFPRGPFRKIKDCFVKKNYSESCLYL
jgi:hypothetical protein